LALGISHWNQTAAHGWLSAVARSVSSWRYRSSSSRDYRLDLLRGFCVFAMIVDHVGGASWLYALTGGNRAIVSAGEGFVFLSGLVAGLVYSRKMLRSGLTATTWALLRRARLLYIMTVSMTLAFVGLASFTSLQLWVDRSSGLGAESWQQILVGTLTLRYAYHGSDILAIYTILLAISPLVFFLLRAGHARWVLAGSWILWAGYALFPSVLHMWDIQNARYFPLAAWQMLFITGLVLGHSVVTAEQRGPVRWSSAVRVAAPWIALATLLLAGVAWMRVFNPFDLLPAESFNPTGLEYERWATGIWDKVYLGPGRLVGFSVIAALAYAVVTLLWRPVDRAIGWLLLPLGGASLYAYVSHLFFVVAGYNLALLGFNEPELAARNSLGQLGVVIVVWAVVQLPSALADLRQALRQLPRPRRLVLPRSLPGIVTAVTMLLVMGHEPAFSAPRSPDAGQVQIPPILPPAQGSSTLTAPIQGNVVPAPSTAPQANPALSQPVVVNPGILPPTVPGEELMVPGLTVATEGPRSLPLHGGQLWPQAFMSTSLQRLMPYYVYLPPGYEKGTDRYPVLYLLHGYYGSFIEWAEVGVHQAADELILSGQIQPMIIVMPEGEQSYYVNHGEDGPRWGDYIVTDVVNEIDRNFRTIPTAEARAIGGLSMGGTGALHLAFTHPDEFGIVGAHAPTLKWDRPEDKFEFADDDYYRSVNPLVEASEVDGIDNLIVLLDIGDDDGGWFTVDQLHDSLDERGVYNKLTYLEGSHAAEYWIEHQWDYLPEYDQAFNMLRNRAAAPAE
jgi:enterochelin esterase-like enzyme